MWTSLNEIIFFYFVKTFPLQVTDMMVANSSNLIITVKPANQRTLATPRRGSFSRNSQVSSGSQHSQHTNNTNTSDEIDQDDQDEVVDLTGTLDDNSLINKKDGVLHLWNDSLKLFSFSFSFVSRHRHSFLLFFIFFIHFSPHFQSVAIFVIMPLRSIMSLNKCLYVRRYKNY